MFNLEKSVEVSSPVEVRVFVVLERVMLGSIVIGLVRTDCFLHSVFSSLTQSQCSIQASFSRL